LEISGFGKEVFLLTSSGIDMIAAYFLQNFDLAFVTTLALDPLQCNPKGTHGQYYES
jgi:hypothetical protein